MLTPEQCQSICNQHDLYWDGRRDELRMLRNLYMTRFFKNDQPVMDGLMRTEVPKAYAVVESYLGSLYAKNPSVEVQADIRGRGNPEVAEATANTYLLTIREQLEDATRLALIYPAGFIKLAPVMSADPLKRVSCAALPPWEVIVDATSSSWEQQRYVGHVYLMPLLEASQRYEKSVDELRARSYSKWIESTGIAGKDQILGLGDPTQTPPEEQWVRVVELYDLLDDALVVWSPDYADGQEHLFTGVKVQVGALDPDAAADQERPDAETEHETTGIPYKTANGRPVVPIIPLYFSRDPDTPLRGYSLIRRSQDQFIELNQLRSYQANGVRRMARQWMVRAGFLSEDAAAKVAQGMDGEFIEVDLQPGAPLEGNMLPVPQAPIPADITIYAQTVQSDIDQAGLLAPFTRGEVTKSTATEQQLLAAYTSSEVGRMARTRDGVITSIARTFNIMLSVVLGEEAEPLSLPNPVGPTILSADDLTGDFSYWAIDAGTTPMSDLTKQQALERLTPLLVQLGADPAQVLGEIVRTYQLPESFAQVAEPEPLAEQPAPLPFPSAGGIPPGDL
tara:strand:+ start:10680 stop:12371 length:1692 start_codon:yes stop_codon:yes gene_type:complete